MRIDFSEIEGTARTGNERGHRRDVGQDVHGEQGKIIPCRIHPGGSIGLHRHETSDDINYILSGTGAAGQFR